MNTQQTKWTAWQDAEDRAAKMWTSSASAQEKQAAAWEAECAKQQWMDEPANEYVRDDGQFGMGA